MSKAVFVNEYGGAGVLSWEDNQVGPPGPDKAIHFRADNPRTFTVQVQVLFYF